MSPEDHLLLSQTGPGTPMGELLRRYWTPALLSSELVADGSPVRVRLMGEDLIAFRDSQGRVGLLDEFCSHRGASLYYARNGESGLRCWYHGWKYDIEGHCLDMPAEPDGSRMRQAIHHTAYPCRERNGVVWAYLGPRDSLRDMPDLEWLLVPPAHCYVSKRIQQCHWTQGLEGDIDPSHLPFLHTETINTHELHGGQASAAWMLKDLSPRIDIFPKPAGLLYASRREAGDDSYFWRISQWLMPGFTTIPAFPGLGPLAGHAWVPMDDTRTLVFTFNWHPTRPITPEEIKSFGGGARTHAELISGTFDPVCNQSNEYARPGTPPAKQPWMRITRFQDQDIAATESMGKNGLFDRMREHLGASDAVVARVRHTLLGAARGLAEGRQPPGKDPKEYRLRPLSVKLPRATEAWAEEVADALEARPETFRASV